jgi:hypothetical protein
MARHRRRTRTTGGHAGARAEGLTERAGVFLTTVGAPAPYREEACKAMDEEEREELLFAMSFTAYRGGGRPA